MRQYFENQTPFRQRIVLSCILRLLLYRHKTNPFKVKRSLPKAAKKLLRTIHGDFMTGQEQTWGAYDKLTARTKLQEITLDYFRTDDQDMQPETLSNLIDKYSSIRLTIEEEKLIFGQPFSEWKKFTPAPLKRPPYIIPSYVRKMAVAVLLLAFITSCAPVPHKSSYGCPVQLKGSGRCVGCY